MEACNKVRFISGSPGEMGRENSWRRGSVHTHAPLRILCQIGSLLSTRVFLRLQPSLSLPPLLKHSKQTLFVFN